MWAEFWEEQSLSNRFLVCFVFLLLSVLLERHMAKTVAPFCIKRRFFFLFFLCFVSIFDEFRVGVFIAINLR